MYTASHHYSTNMQRRRGRRSSTTSTITQEVGEVMLMLVPLDLGHLLRVSVIAAQCSLRHTMQTS
ncbi:hypothetical protein HBI56_021340 [Parastagonospora nodorum]|uniref:Uncharacterized protein n=1 Tax=Phaeosphaeria nodorum (strain SN15 / ATCC MYA-4574 / FGSC 10173) TaxID=321614 RepID=A0A7U2F0Y9_PHANO|nr:hypothetical protein HBH56_174310 [Parastagonospora nodorum]QRC96367.1 hypothetical protein JI435_408840 [Parastagonospora nodorum SN15]KAH3926416.1 hypothetical protein HBH54_168820 [Parastagonospora nodorum]KAH3955656.1 hypothetical protein HBH53_001650 [Parastagonospora nodorum]KAH3965565.1 hypothetical protein HBH52_205500 [Parastagonospora nodorum]